MSSTLFLMSLGVLLVVASFSPPIVISTDPGPPIINNGSTNLPMANIQQLEAERVPNFKERAKAVVGAGLLVNNMKSVVQEGEEVAGKQKGQQGQTDHPWLNDVNMQLEPSTPESARPRRRETVAQRRARLCSDSLSPLVPEMLEKSPPFAIFYHSGQYGDEKGADAEKYNIPTRPTSARQANLRFWETLWNKAMPCHIGLAQLAKMAPDCISLAGFVDHLFPTGPPAGTLITELGGPKLDGQPAVVRLLCAENALKFMEALQSVGRFKSIQQLPSEEFFLKTVFAMEFGWFPGCIVVFFDARTLDPERHPMGRLLLLQQGGPALKRGTKDGANPWAATKFICGQRATHAFRSELQRMRFRNRYGSRRHISDSTEDGKRK